ncbi:hypothetical protein QO259_04410 [Salinicola sp. JS01]|uniref:hypothetical protein n=1 Tax=Salinicola sp. JS01 TaxID=3050071 RepID=UPI00255BD8A0|nr:hypothetical protein [Salinicola sp. JS01]WIX33915.1 hypothetical protein QO259_04410 [Salinicola sp. JS01]
MRSSPNNRLNAIMEALLAAHNDAQQLSRSSLHRMPEFFMAMRVADYFAEHFDNFGYRLEAQVKRTFEASDMQVDDITELLREPDLRPEGRFDLVLHTGKRGRTAHILEFKRGDAMRGLISDIRRLAKVSRHAGRHSLKTNYLVLTRRCPPNRDTSDRLIERLGNRLHTEGLDDLDVNLIASEPQHPFLNHDHLPMSNRAFQIVILEIQG